MMKEIPVYPYPASYAREQGELDTYRASGKADMACKEAIEAAIREHYRDNHLGGNAVKQVVDQFGYDRTFRVLAITVSQKDWDTRFSQENKAWAKTIPTFENLDAWGNDRNCYLVVNSHSGLVDLFLSQARKDYAQEQHKSSVRDKLKVQHQVTSPQIAAKSKGQER